jgi:phage gp45-like
MSQHEHVYDHRVSATRGIVTSILDHGIVQTADVQTHHGVLRGQVEVYQPFGFTSVAPVNGSTMVLLANGGDESDMIGLPAACPSARLGGLLPGESAIYGVDGTRVHIKQGGTITVLAAHVVEIAAVNCTITGTILLAGDVTITGSLNVDGDITASGAITGG